MEIIEHPDTDELTEYHLEEEDCLPDSEVEARKGEKLTDDDWDTLVGPETGSAIVYKPDGDILAVYLHDYIDRDACVEAYKALRTAAFNGSVNRGTATGKGSRSKRVKEDGSVSSTNQVKPEMEPNTGIAGYYDRYPRIPYCRQTAYNVNNPDKFARAIPFFQQAAEAFKQYVPERYEAQNAVAQETVEDWVISETPFTTVTVNLNWQTALHTDSGDYEEGFGVMPVIDTGNYDGAYFMEPKFGMAYDARTGDVLLNDVHEWHGNGPFHSSEGYYERLSVVLYYRREMAECGTPEEELARAKQIRDYADDPDELGSEEKQITQRDYGES